MLAAPRTIIDSAQPQVQSPAQTAEPEEHVLHLSEDEVVGRMFGIRRGGAESDLVDLESGPADLMSSMLRNEAAYYEVATPVATVDAVSSSSSVDMEAERARWKRRKRRRKIIVSMILVLILAAAAYAIYRMLA